MKPPIEYRPKIARFDDEPEPKEMTEAEVMRAALADPDAQPLTKEDLTRMPRRKVLVSSPDCPVCQERRKKNLEAVRRHRREKGRGER